MHFGVTELLIILAIVALLFGTKKLRNIGGDLGGAIRSFRKSMSEGEEAVHEAEQAASLERKPGRTIDGEVGSKAEDKQA